jgi:putative phage-type endonuclease
MEQLKRADSLRACGKTFDRSSGLGGSDIAAIVGLSPYRSPLDVWAEKVGHPSVISKDSLHLRFGTHLEPFVASEYERLTGNQTHVYEGLLRHPSYPHLFGHVDRLVTNEGQHCVGPNGVISASTVLECKTASAFMQAEWGECWSDQVPAAYLAQCIWYMSLTGCEQSHIAVLIGNSDLRIYCIKRDLELEQLLIEAAIKFWDEHVLTGDPPSPRNRDEALKLFPIAFDSQEIVADSDMLDKLRRYKRLQSGLKEIEEESNRIKDEITCAMGAAERISYGGETVATWKNIKPSVRIDVARIRRERPDLFVDYSLSTSPTRRFVLEGL